MFVSAADGAVQWHYEEGLDLIGPTHWFEIEGAELCGHSQQSPIEIDPSWFPRDGSCGSPLIWTVSRSKKYNFSVSHKGESGHTIVFQNDELSTDVHLENAFQSASSPQHSRYLLDSLHLHWGPGDQNGSEHIFSGITTTLEVHFVHYSADYDSVGEAVGAWESASLSDDPNTNDMHTLGVVGFLFEEVAENEDYHETADAVLLSLATDSGMQSVWSNATGSAVLEFGISDFVNSTDFTERYYHYDGSLTTPPC